MQCRVCGSAKVRRLGALPKVDNFAGRQHGTAMLDGALFRCKECTFLFRAPILSELEYVRLYQTGSAEVWESGEDREDFRRVKKELLAHSSIQDVLDIGCYSGKLLASLPDKFRRFGIEPNIDAARIARSRGIDVIAETVEQLVTLTNRFDAIVACDVIEHLPDPLAFLSQLRKLLRAGGLLLLTTGNADSLLWRIVGPRFWYSYFPEHISFVGARWLRHEPAKAGLTFGKIERFNYRGNAPFTKRFIAIVASLSYAISPRFYRFGKERIFNATVPFVAPPGCGATKDHLFCVLTTK